jgi:tetratricopeptide (TPR) repeat protein
VDIVATGPLSALPQMENELAWNILHAIGEMRDLSRETFGSRTRKVPNDAFALFIRGLTEGDEVEAIKLLEQAVDQGKDFAEAQLRLGRYYFQQGDCAKAIPQLMATHDENGDYFQEEFMLATCYLETEKLTEAVQTYDHLNSLAPGIESLNNQGVAYTRKGDYPAAIKNFIQARRLAGTDPTINLNLAVLRHLQGDDSAARDILTEATKSYPNSGMIQFVFGVVLKALGENEQADAALAKAKSLGIQDDTLSSENPGRWTRIMPRGQYP